MTSTGGCRIHTRALRRGGIKKDSLPVIRKGQHLNNPWAEKSAVPRVIWGSPSDRYRGPGKENGIDHRSNIKRVSQWDHRVLGIRGESYKERGKRGCSSRPGWRKERKHERLIPLCGLRADIQDTCEGKRASPRACCRKCYTVSG